MTEEIRQLYQNNVRLNNVKSVNRLLARVTNALLQNEIEESRARTIGYLCNIMVSALKTGDLEDRLLELEENLKKVV